MGTVSVNVAVRHRAGYLRHLVDESGGRPLPTVVKEVLVTQLFSDENVPPLSTTDPRERVTIWLNDREAALAKHMADAASYRSVASYLGDLIEALARAWSASRVAESAGSVSLPADLSEIERINAALGNSTSQYQLAFFKGIRATEDSAVEHEVTFAEGSTGIGKTRAYLASVLEWSRTHPDKRAVIAVPTLLLVRQVHDELVRIQRAVPGTPSHRCIAGRGEFVSQTALSDFLNSSETLSDDLRAAARDWMASGAPPLPESPLQHRWTRESLANATNDLWTQWSDVVLDARDNDDDPGEVAYRAQFEPATANAPITVCTHAMLATHVREAFLESYRAHSTNNQAELSEVYRAFWRDVRNADVDWRDDRVSYRIAETLECAGPVEARLGPLDLLLVDEAHQLEERFAQVFSHAFSVSRAILHVGELKRLGAKIKVASLDALKAALESLRALGRDSGGNTLSLRHHTLARQICARVLTELSELTIPKALATSERARALYRMRNALQQVQKLQAQGGGLSGYIEWSPDLFMPRIVVGRYTVETELAFLWQAVAARSILVSGTLADVSDGSYEACREVLGVRHSLVIERPPISPVWLLNPVTAYVASRTMRPDGIQRLCPPGERAEAEANESAVASWRREVGDYIQQARASAVGGMLVLCTAYSDVQVWAETLRTVDENAEDVIEHSAEIPLARLRKQYLDLALGGRRPVLLAVGAAWTGLDLAVSARELEVAGLEQDNVLTDLIIPRAPLGVNRSLTHAYRREKRGIYVEAHAAVMALRQGVGRLVRKEGTPPNRRLHFLDSRIHGSPHGKGNMSGLLSPIRLFLAQYPRRVDV